MRISYEPCTHIWNATVDCAHIYRNLEEIFEGFTLVVFKQRMSQNTFVGSNSQGTDICQARNPSRNRLDT
jgi:hypothetical protein